MVTRKLSLLFAFLFAIVFGWQGSYAQDEDQDTVIAAATIEASPAKLKQFRTALIKAAEQACRDGEISRIELFKVRVASLSEKGLVKMHQAAAEQAFADGRIQSYSAIDWTQLVSLIKELLLVILQLIELFS